jgi:hypothetical protein
MITPWQVFFTLQLAMLDGWVKVLRDSGATWERMAMVQAKMFDHPMRARQQDVMPAGPALADHYGRREHDVNIERV